MAPKTSAMNSTSHRALSVGGGAEVIGDVDEGGNDVGAGSGAEVINENGLTDEQQAEFDRMRTGEAGDDSGGPDSGEEGDETDEADAGDDDTGGEEPPAAGPLGKKEAPQLAREADTGQKSPPRTVNLSKHQRALKKAADEATAARAEAQKEREERLKLNERIAIINEALQARAAQEAAPPPDPNAPPENPFEEEDIDPTVDYAASVQQLQRRQRFQNEQYSRVETTVAESREDQQIRESYDRDFRALAQQDPTLPAAYQFLKDSRLTEIAITEFDKDPNDPNETFTPQEVEKLVQMFNAEEKWVVTSALKAKKSPAAAILRLAKVRGFRPAPPPAPAPKPNGQAPRAPAVPAVRNGTAPPAPRAPAPAAPSAQDLLTQLQEAQAGGRSLSDGGGAPPEGLTAEAILRLGDEEFAELVDSLPKYQLDALMGRVAT